MKNPQRPSQIGRYEIRSELGRGMMGVVYEAQDPALGRTIALKTIRLDFAASAREREQYERRFLAEARIAARLSHPGIVVVHDVGRDAEHGILYIALEYLHGRTLAEMAAESDRPDWREALRIVGRVAQALHYAHAEGVVHRDIKPANIMVLRSGEPKILDFGIARVETAQMTSTGQFFGTPLYTSPEQALGQPVDSRTDLFSLGAVAYTILTGRPPFDGPNVPGILARVAYQEPRPPTEVAPGLPADLDDVLARALAKAPSDRYPDGKTLAEDLDDLRAGRRPRHRDEWTPPVRGEGTLVARRAAGAPERELELQFLDGTAPARRRRRRPAAGLVMLLAAAVAGYFYLHPIDRRFWRARAGEAARTSAVQDALSWLASLVPASRQEPPRAMAVPVPVTPHPGRPAAGPPEPTPDPAPTSVRDATPEPPAAPAEVVEPPALPPTSPEPLPPEAVTPPAAPLPSTGGEAAPGKLAIEFEHHLRRGNLKVWVDDARVLDEDFDGRVTRKILLLKLRKGLVQEVLTLPPGRHEVRVQVSWDDNVKSARIAGTFRSGITRRLDVEVGRIGGKLALAWK